MGGRAAGRSCAAYARAGGWAGHGAYACTDVLVPMPPFTHLVDTYAGAVLVFCSGVMVVLHAVMALIFLLDG